MDCLENELIIMKKPCCTFVLIVFLYFFIKGTVYKTHLFWLLMRSEITALCILGSGFCFFFNNRLVTGKGIKYFENAAKEMGIFYGCFYLQKRKIDFALIFT